MNYRERYKERAAHLEQVRGRRAVVKGREDYNFEQHLTTELRGTYAGTARVQIWQRQCLNPHYLQQLEEHVEKLAALADWEEIEERKWRRRNRMPPTSAELQELVASRRDARAVSADEPPPLPIYEEEAVVPAQPTNPLHRDEITLFGSARKVQQVTPFNKRKRKQND
jgi:hypothetical protein